MNITVNGFTPSNKRPGFFGRQIFASGSTSGALFGLICLVVGMGNGTATPDTAVYDIESEDDGRTLAGQGQNGSLMVNGALANSGVTLKYIQPAAVSGGVASSLVLQIANDGTPWSSSGDWLLRIGGVQLSGVVQATDTASSLATTIAAAINGTPDLPFTATASSGNVTITTLTTGSHGNQWIGFVDSSQLPGHCTMTLLGKAWAATTAYTLNQFAVPTSSTGFIYKCTTAGTSNSSAPTWPTTLGGTVTDGTVTWTCWSKVLQGSNTEIGATFGGGSGTPNYTNVIETLSTAQYDIIAVDANDATNLGLLKAFVDGQMAPTIGLLNAVVFGTNVITSTAAQSLSTTTLNDPSFEQVYIPNCETHPAVIAASHGALRAITESSNPNPRYMNTAIAGGVAQANKNDWQTDPTANACLNAGVTPGTTLTDGTLVVMRAITTYCRTTGGNQDDRVLDINEFSMSKYARMRIAQMWNDDIAPNYNEVQPDPPAEGPDPATNVLYPALMQSFLISEELTWETNGWQVTGTSAAYPPIVQFNPSGRNLLFDMTVVPTPGNYQLGGNIRQRPI